MPQAGQVKFLYLLKKLVSTIGAHAFANFHLNMKSNIKANFENTKEYE